LLEIGCGTGQTLRELAGMMGKGGRLIGLDLSPGMINQAQSSLQENQAIVSFLQSDGLKLPLTTNCCDALFMSFTLELFDIQDQHRLLGEARRVLKENGRLALVTLSAHEQTGASSIYWSLHEMFPKIVDCRPLSAAPLLAAAGFSTTHQENHSMFGLPLSIFLTTPIPT
jgi:demethylmenaquinone methyltransferase/2-methoxy-6-polyprenyl-1,4-benzoquinol methylase